MDRFLSMQVFVSVSELGGFSAAARALSMSPPAVTRAVSSLEERLGTRLFVRTTRSVRLTQSGERFLLDARRILAEVTEAEDAAIGSHAAPRGEIRITAPVLLGRMFVAPILGDFLGQYPLLSAETLFVDRVVNLMDEGHDVAIRIGALPDSTLSAVRCGSVCRTLFAAPSYLAAHGVPQRPEDLVDHQLIHSLAMGNAGQWQFAENGAPLNVRVTPRLRMNTNDAVIELALRGWGISRLLSYQVAHALADGRLVSVLEDFEMETLPIHVVHQEGRMVSAKVRAFVDFMVDRLRADPALDSNGHG